MEERDQSSRHRAERPFLPAFPCGSVGLPGAARVLSQGFERSRLREGLSAVENAGLADIARRGAQRLRGRPRRISLPGRSHESAHLNEAACLPRAGDQAVAVVELKTRPLRSLLRADAAPLQRVTAIGVRWSTSLLNTPPWSCSPAASRLHHRGGDGLSSRPRPRPPLPFGPGRNDAQVHDY